MWHTLQKNNIGGKLKQGLVVIRRKFYGLSSLYIKCWRKILHVSIQRSLKPCIRHSGRWKYCINVGILFHWNLKETFKTTVEIIFSWLLHCSALQSLAFDLKRGTTKMTWYAVVLLKTMFWKELSVIQMTKCNLHVIKV